MRIKPWVSWILVVALLGQISTALAQTPIDTLTDNHNHIIGFLTGVEKEKNGKDVMIGLFHTKNDKDPLYAYFPDVAAWQKFVNLWSQAMAKATPSKGSDGVRIGDYEDPDGVLLTITKYDDSNVVIALVGHDFATRIFEINQEGYSMFTDTVAKVTALLKK